MNLRKHVFFGLPWRPYHFLNRGWLFRFYGVAIGEWFFGVLKRERIPGKNRRQIDRRTMDALEDLDR